METFKHILAGIVIAISILGLILCLAGLMGVWVVNTPLTTNLTGTLDQVEAVLVFSQDRLEQADGNLTEAQDLLTNLDEAVTQAGDHLTENSPTLSLLSNTVGEKLKPKFEMIAEVIGTLRGTIISINNTLEAANSIPFIDIPTLPMDELTAIDLQMQEAVVSVKSLGEAIQDVEAGVIDRTSKAILLPVEKLSNGINQVQTPVIAAKGKLAEIESAVVDLNTRIPALIDWGSVLCTVVLIWMILAQATLLYNSWCYWKTGAIPVVQNSLPPKISGG